MQLPPMHLCLLAVFACLTIFLFASIFIVREGPNYLEQRYGFNSSYKGWADSLKQQAQSLKGIKQVSRLGAAPYEPKPLFRSDFAAAVYTDQGHEDYIHASRVWRQGIKTFVATNHNVDAATKRALLEKHNESWGYYTDDVPQRSWYKGDSRGALVPFLAFRAIEQPYKWMLYGDDDTLFFPDTTAKLLQNLDPDMPYFLTDHLWWTDKWEIKNGIPEPRPQHPSDTAPSCVPCGYNGSTEALPFPYPRGCPCTPQVICDADKKGVFYQRPRGRCGFPGNPLYIHGMHGGAGAILSIGLLHAISFEAFEDCVMTTFSSGSDAFISICLWEVGFGMTTMDPLWHPDGQSMFDVGAIAQGDKDDILPRIAAVMGNLVQAAVGECQEGLCKLELDHRITLHMRSRKFPSKGAQAEVSRLLARLAELAQGKAQTWIVDSEDDVKKATDEQVALGLEAFKEWLQCQALQTDKQKEDCKKDGKELAGEGQKAAMLALLWKSPDMAHAANSLAQHFVRQIFERHPRAKR